MMYLLMQTAHMALNLCFRLVRIMVSRCMRNNPGASLIRILFATGAHEYSCADDTATGVSLLQHVFIFGAKLTVR